MTFRERWGRFLVYGWGLGSLLAVLGGCSYSPYAPTPLAFSGDSSAAASSVVVPTLDTPRPQGKNVIWCGTLQLAWDQMKTLAPVSPPGSRDVIDRLNHAQMNFSDLPEGSYYAAAGWARDGIVEKIRAEMHQRFPEVKPDLPSEQGVEVLAYAYLAAKVRFAKSYVDQPEGHEFRDSAGHKTAITCFGLSPNPDDALNEVLAKQIDVLYCGERPKTPPYQMEYVLDLDKNTPSQLLLAAVEPRETLAATWQEVRAKMDGWKAARNSTAFSSEDKLLVPNVHFEIREGFPELSQAAPSLAAMQMIGFQLDRSGASLTSQAWIMALSGGSRYFNFTRPFLIVLRKRGATEPYFMMWVDNAELLCKPK